VKELENSAVQVPLEVVRIAWEAPRVFRNYATFIDQQMVGDTKLL
jgi:hypothetical protein